VKDGEATEGVLPIEMLTDGSHLAVLNSNITCFIDRVFDLAYTPEVHFDSP
jgi:hypothetical protein